MGRFEIILILIGVVWTIVSAVAQKKAKAAKLASMQAEDPGSMLFSDDDDAYAEPVTEVGVDLDIPDQSSLLQKLRQKRLAQLRSRAGFAQPVGIASGTPIRVPPQARTIPLPEETGEPHHAEAMEQLPPIDEHGHERASASEALRTGTAAQRLRDVLGDRLRVRDAFVLNELLSQPLSIRKTSRS